MGTKPQALKPQRLLIAAGGTGGHVFPGLAVADYVQKAGFSVEWLGGEKGMEQRLVPNKYPLHTLPMIAFRGKGILNKGLATMGLVRAFLQARRILKDREASVVLVMGGYVSAPVGLAAKSLGIPLVVHEQNAVAGMANRRLCGMATQVFEAFPDTFAKSIKAIHSGNPLREGFYAEKPGRKPDGKLHVLVMGGSRGARAINQAVAETIADLSDERVEWWHQTGEDDFDQYDKQYAGQSQLRCEAFIEDTAAALDWADLVISRAGALSVSEVAAIGTAALFIPYPHAVDDHQYYNAKQLEVLSAAVIVRQRDVSAALLTAKIKAWLDDPELLVSMRSRANELATPNATRVVGDCCLSLGGAGKEFEFLKKQGIRSIHCTGIGGIGVSGLAAILQLSGYAVTGVDSKHTATIDYLESLGVKMVPDSAAQVAKTDCLIYSRAIAPDRADMQAAKGRGIPVYSRGEFLAQLVGKSRSLVVAGSHGKSTTSGWAAFSLQTAGVCVNTYLGAVIEGRETSVHMAASDAPWVLESDESDASCFLLSPTCLVITNIDADHLETYEGSLAVLQDRMVEWANAMESSGLVIACQDDPGVQAILPRLKGRKITYGFSEKADCQLLSCSQHGADSELRWRLPDGEEVAARIKLPGKHNALNGLAAWIACREFNALSAAKLTPAWSGYPGVKRRMSIHGAFALDEGEALIIEDYGHHPREMQVTLDALRSAWPHKRIVMLFQPHRYTRTRDLFHEFVGVLKGVDQLYLLPIYTAGEKQDLGMSSEKIAAAIEVAGAQRPIIYPDLEEAERALREALQADDVLVLQGAGSVGGLAQQFFAPPKGSRDVAKE